MTNPVYFKTIIFNIWCIILIICALIIYFYNMRCASIVATGVNTAATVTFPFLFMAILVDSVHETFVRYRVESLSGSAQIVISVIMLVFSIFSVLYILSYKAIFTQCVELNCFKGYTPLTEKRRKLDYDMIVSALDQDGNIPEAEQERLEKYKALKRTDWFAVLNLHIMINVIWGTAMTTCLLSITYIMRTWSIYDNNLNREIDVSVCSAIVLVIFLVTLIYDYFFFRTYTYPIFMQYAAVFMYAISLMVEFHRMIGFEEAFSLILMSLSAAAVILKIRAGVDFHQRKFFKIM